MRPGEYPLTKTMMTYWAVKVVNRWVGAEYIGSEEMMAVRIYSLEVWTWKARVKWSKSRKVWGQVMEGLALVGFCFLSISMLSKAENSMLSLPDLLPTIRLPPPKRNATLMKTRTYITQSLAHFQNTGFGKKREHDYFHSAFHSPSSLWIFFFFFSNHFSYYLALSFFPSQANTCPH